MDYCVFEFRLRLSGGQYLNSQSVQQSRPLSDPLASPSNPRPGGFLSLKKSRVQHRREISFRRKCSSLPRISLDQFPIRNWRVLFTFRSTESLQKLGTDQFPDPLSYQRSGSLEDRGGKPRGGGCCHRYWHRPESP